MGTPTRDNLIKLATNSSLTQDASVPQRLSDEKKQEIKQLTKLRDLKRKRIQLRRNLIAQYHRLHKARGTALYSEFKRAQKWVRAERKKLHKIAKDEQHGNFFKNIRNRIVEGNYQGSRLPLSPTYLMWSRREKLLLTLSSRIGTWIRSVTLSCLRIVSNLSRWG